MTRSGRGTSGLGVAADAPYAERVVLLEREHELGVLNTSVAGVGAGDGSAVALCGDSGTGKTALVEAALAGSGDPRVLRGSCDPLATPRPLGPFRDVAAAAGLPSLVAADETLAHVCEEVYAALAAVPTVLVVEDLHWVDAASVEVLRFLVRRVESLPLALVLTYRDVEIGPRHSARPLLGEIARAESAVSLPLAPLSVDAVKLLLDGTALEAEAVHDLTNGNPFFVVEVAKDPDRPLPASVRDAVLARTLDVGAEDFEVLQLVASAPDRIDDRLLPALGVDLPTLRRLDDTGLLARARGGLVFRHELARQAVESTVPAGGSSVLHARVLDALEGLHPREPAVLTHHAVAAHDGPRAHRYATEAAEEAARTGSHTEAAAFYRIALDHLAGTDPRERADLMQRLSFEQYMIAHLTEALDNVRATFLLWEQVDDTQGLAAAHETAAIYEYYNAHRRQAELHAERAMAVAGPSSGLAYAGARATRGYLAYMGHDYDLATAYIEDAGSIAEQEGHQPLGVRTALFRRILDFSAGVDDARTRLTESIEEARGHGLDELASTGYSQLAYLDVEQRRLRSAEHVLDESLPFTVERDIPICRHWQTAVRSRLRFLEGRWSAALEDADFVTGNEGMPLAHLWPNVVRALIRLRQGSDEDTSTLDDAWELATRLEEPARRLWVLAGLAERQWMTGVADERVSDLALPDLRAWAGEPGTEWAVGELAVLLRRLDLLHEVPEGVAEPFRLSLTGRHEEAASWWRQAGEPFTEAMSWVDSDDPAHQARGVELLDKTGATATADRVRVELRQAGVAVVPPRPRESTRANPGGLTNRQLDVARLVARGFTNAEIAARLFISPKTADHHVSAVLAKLGMTNRRAVLVRADELGLA